MNRKWTCSPRCCALAGLSQAGSQRDTATRTVATPPRGQGFQGAKFSVNEFNMLVFMVQIYLMKKSI